MQLLNKYIGNHNPYFVKYGLADAAAWLDFIDQICLWPISLLI